MSTATQSLPQSILPCWGMLEMLGHRQIPGLLEEVEMAGAKFIRVTTPAVEGCEAKVQIVGPASVYAMTPSTEEAIKSLWRSRFAPLELAALIANEDEDEEDDLDNSEEF